MKKIKVLMLLKSPVYNDSRVIKEANSLSDAGYDVVVLFCSNYILSKKFNFKTKRIKSYRRDSSIFKKIVYSIFNSLMMTYSGIRVKPDITHCHDLNTLIDGYIISLFCKSKLVYDSHELFYEMSLQKKLNRFNKYLKKILFIFFRIIEKVLGKKADTIITVSGSIGGKIKRNIGVDYNKINIIRNCVEKNNNTSYFNKNIFNEIFTETKGKTIILIQGYVTEFRFDEVILDGLQYLKNTTLLILGDIQNNYKDRLMYIIKQKKINKMVFLLEPVDRELLYKYTKSADIGLILLKNVSLNHYYALPNKLFEYISCGVPVLSTRMFELERIINKYKIGELYDEGSEESFINSFEKIMRNSQYYHNNCLDTFNDYLNWGIEEKKLLGLYSKLINSRI